MKPRACHPAPSGTPIALVLCAVCCLLLAGCILSLFRTDSTQLAGLQSQSSLQCPADCRRAGGLGDCKEGRPGSLCDQPHLCAGPSHFGEDRCHQHQECEGGLHLCRIIAQMPVCDATAVSRIVLLCAPHSTTDGFALLHDGLMPVKLSCLLQQQCQYLYSPWLRFVQTWHAARLAPARDACQLSGFIA